MSPQALALLFRLRLILGILLQVVAAIEAAQGLSLAARRYGRIKRRAQTARRRK